jgi:hypothetical protein
VTQGALPQAQRADRLFKRRPKEKYPSQSCHTWKNNRHTRGRIATFLRSHHRTMIGCDRRSEAEEFDEYGVGSSAQRAPN